MILWLDPTKNESWRSNRVCILFLLVILCTNKNYDCCSLHNWDWTCLWLWSLVNVMNFAFDAGLVILFLASTYLWILIMLWRALAGQRILSYNWCNVICVIFNIIYVYIAYVYMHHIPYDRLTVVSTNRLTIQHHFCLEISLWSYFFCSLFILQNSGSKILKNCKQIPLLLRTIRIRCRFISVSIFSLPYLKNIIIFWPNKKN